MLTPAFGLTYQTFRTGGNLITARRQFSGAGTASAGITAGGYTSARVFVTETYDGSTWSSSGNISSQRDWLGVTGTATATLVTGGASLATTDEYDGVSWATGGALPAARSGLAASGTQTDGVAFGGVTNQTTTYTYDGAAWSTSGYTLLTGRDYHSGCGASSSTLAVCGGTNTTEEWAGAGWSIGGNAPSSYGETAAAGNSGSAIVFGGNISSGSGSILYNGTTWSVGSTTSTAHATGPAGFGTGATAVITGGVASGNTAVTEEWDWL